MVALIRFTILQFFQLRESVVLYLKPLIYICFGAWRIMVNPPTEHYFQDIPGPLEKGYFTTFLMDKNLACPPSYSTPVYLSKNFHTCQCNASTWCDEELRFPVSRISGWIWDHIHLRVWDDLQREFKFLGITLFFSNYQFLHQSQMRFLISDTVFLITLPLS